LFSCAFPGFLFVYAGLIGACRARAVKEAKEKFTQKEKNWAEKRKVVYLCTRILM